MLYNTRKQAKASLICFNDSLKKKHKIVKVKHQTLKNWIDHIDNGAKEVFEAKYTKVYISK